MVSDMNQRDIELYRQEIDELTTLLNTEWLDLRGLLEQSGVKTKGGRLVSYFEDEEGSQCGIIITSENDIVKFEVTGSAFKKEIIKDINISEDEYPQVIAALNY